MPKIVRSDVMIDNMPFHLCIKKEFYDNFGSILYISKYKIITFVWKVNG
jgi:hypothetical protein